MNHHTLTQNSEDKYKPFLLQGASEIITHYNSFVAVWTENTPLLDGSKIATIGGCHFSNAKEGVELLQYTANYLLRSFSNVVGPMNGNTWLDHRLVTFSDGSPPFILEPSTPLDWVNIFQEAGFSILSRYSSSRIKLSSTKNEKLERLSHRLQSKGVSIRPLNPNTFQKDLSAIYELSSETFKHNFLYTDLAKSTFLEKYESSREHLDPELILLAEKDNELVGFVFCYPDPSGTLIVKTLASHPSKGVAGIGNILVEQVQQVAYSKGYKQAIHALQFDDNSSLKITSRYDPDVLRRYALLAKTNS